MLKKLLSKLKKPTNDYKIISFYKFAFSMGVIKDQEINTIDIEALLLKSFLFLTQEKIVTKKQQQELTLFQDRYNRFLHYCIEKKFIKKDEFKEVTSLGAKTIPDMSHIEIPDITKELNEMNFDLDKLSNMFSKMK